MKRAIVVLLVLTTVMAVQGAPKNTEPTGVKDSECFECHQTGGEGSGPVLQEVFRIFMSSDVFTDGSVTLERGSSLDLTFDIRNWWTAELRGFSGHIDLTDAPAFSFEPAKDPVGGGREGSLPEYEPIEYFQSTPRTAQVQVDIPAGGTELNLALTPEEGTGADLLLRVWAPGANPERDPPLFEQDDAGPGEAETITIQEDPVQGGPYIIEAEETPDPASYGIGAFDPVGFNVDWTLSFDFEAGDPIRSGATLVVLDGQDKTEAQSTPISWPVNVVEDITTEQRLRVYMETAAYYAHAPQFRAVDEWLYWNHVEYYITPDEAGNIHIDRVTPDGDRVTEYIIGDEVLAVGPSDEEPDLTEELEVTMDVAAEVVGYAAAFLLIISLLSGGAFGNWSRHLQQWVIYRRAKKRVAFHNVVSYGLILAATVHMVLFLVEPRYPWTIGFFLGGVSILGMFGSGITGAYQRVMVRGMGHEAWRWLHYLSFVLAFAGAAAHILLDGIHFQEFQAAIGWEDPVAPVLEQIIPIDAPGGAGNNTAAE